MKKNRDDLNRRDALKLAGIGSAAMILGTTQEAQASATGPQKRSSKKKPLRIVIIGGGMAGTTLAYRLRRAITWPEITVFEPLQNSAWYQPGLTMLGTGLWCERTIECHRDDFIPEGIEWIKSAVVSVDTSNNTVTDRNGEKKEYDYLIITSGAVLDYGAIEGLEGEIISLKTEEEKKAWMDDPHIGSVYYLHGASKLFEQLNMVVQKAIELQGDDKLSVLFTQESIHIKSPGAAKSILNALLAKLKEAGVRHKVEITINSGDGRLSANDKYDKMYKKILKKEGVFFENEHLMNVDTQIKAVNFTNGKSMGYDFLHIAPSMHADKIFEKSGMTNKEGWIDVDTATLQHRQFDNIFAAGDAAGTSALKTASAIVDQVKTIVETIRAIDEDKKPTAKYSGYGCDSIICPDKKSVLFEAYDNRKKPLSVFSFIDPLECHMLYWYLNTRMLKPYVIYGVMKGWV